MAIESPREPLIIELIRNYLNQKGKKQAAAKGVLTRYMNDFAEKVGVVAAKSQLLEVLEEFSDLPDWLKKRLTPGSWYWEGDRLFGWWDEEQQVQAEHLPIYFSSSAYSVSFSGLSNSEIRLWQSRGFYHAQPLPVEYKYGHLEVSFNVKQTPFFLNYGYALPCPLQWNWDSDHDGLVVTRSIISEGWWQAWKWWDGAKFWYLEHRPELFADDTDLWGIDEPQPDFQAAVLGIQGRGYWERVRLAVE